MTILSCFECIVVMKCSTVAWSTCNQMIPSPPLVHEQLSDPPGFMFIRVDKGFYSGTHGGRVGSFKQSQLGSEPLDRRILNTVAGPVVGIDSGMVENIS